MLNQKRSWFTPLPLAVIGLSLGLAFLLGPIDLRISQALVDYNSSWAKFFEVFGEHPAVLLVWAGSHILLAASRTRQGGLSSALKALLLAANLLAGCAFVDMTAERALHTKPTGFQSLITLLAVTALALLVQRLLARLPAERLARFEQAAWLSLLLIAGELAVVHALKWAWGRVRFRDLLPDQSNFTLWYLPQGPTGHRSFPSGHAANSWTLLLLPVYAAAAGLRAYWRYAAWACALLWAGLTSLSRMVIGAHFATDVLFGACITITLYIVLQRTFRVHIAPSRLQPFTQRNRPPM